MLTNLLCLLASQVPTLKGPMASTGASPWETRIAALWETRTAALSIVTMYRKATSSRLGFLAIFQFLLLKKKKTLPWLISFVHLFEIEVALFLKLQSISVKIETMLATG